MAINPNSLYPTQTTAPSGNYPWGGAQNVTVDGDGTGTPWIDQVLNDMWGYFQKLLDYSGITPSGSPDTVPASQYFQALQASAGYPGVIVPLGLNADPSTFGLRILPMIGQLIVSSLYPNLVSNTYVGDPYNATANSFIKTDGTGTPITTGTFFRLPDARGRFLRGLDSGAIRDEGGSGRIVGSFQTGAVSAHEHELVDNAKTSKLGNQTDNTDTGAPTHQTVSTAGGVALPNYATTIVSGNNSTSDNRPYNMAVTYGIWY
jgi:hypothetical protein